MSGFIGRMFGSGSSKTAQTPTISSKTAQTAALKKPEVKKTSKTATSVLPAPSAHHHSSVPTGSSSPIAASLASPRIASFSLPSTFQIPGPIVHKIISDEEMDLIVQQTLAAEARIIAGAEAIAEIFVEEGFIQVAEDKEDDMIDKLADFLKDREVSNVIMLFSIEGKLTIHFEETGLFKLLSFINNNMHIIQSTDFTFKNAQRCIECNSLDEYDWFLSQIERLNFVKLNA